MGSGCDNRLKGPRYKVAAEEPAVLHHGLLKTISREDLKDTDAYLFNRFSKLGFLLMGRPLTCT